MKLFLSCLTALITLILFEKSILLAANTTNITATVKTGVCGDGIRDTGEECDSNYLNNKNCTDLGYSGGTLSCGASCDFKVTSCVVPEIDSDDVVPDEIDSLYAAGYLSVPSDQEMTSTDEITVNNNLKIKSSTSTEASNVQLSSGATISVNGGTIDVTHDLGISMINSTQISGVANSLSPLGGIQWGVPGVTLNFDVPITINLFVGTGYNGQTLDVQRSVSLSSGWTTDGIVAPATCKVTGGYCTFQAEKASYYTALLSNSGSGSTSSSSTNSTSNTTSQSSGVSTPVGSATTISESFHLPSALSVFDINGLGRILITDLPAVAKKWYKSWKNATSNSRQMDGTSTRGEICDLDRDLVCDVKDFSILMYYIGR